MNWECAIPGKKGVKLLTHSLSSSLHSWPLHSLTCFNGSFHRHRGKEGCSNCACCSRMTILLRLQNVSYSVWLGSSEKHRLRDPCTQSLNALELNLTHSASYYLSVANNTQKNVPCGIWIIYSCNTSLICPFLWFHIITIFTSLFFYLGSAILQKRARFVGAFTCLKGEKNKVVS